MSLDIPSFLQRFFGAGNDFSLGEIEKGGNTPAGKLRPWVERLRTHSPQRTVLPYWRKGQKIDWYGMAFTDAELRILGEELTAFIGPSYSDFRGLPAVLDESHPIERAVRELTGGRAFHFRGRNSSGDKDIFNGLTLLRTSWEYRKGRARALPRATSAVLRDLYLAIQAGHRASAEEHLRFLQENFRLDALNLLFLRVQILSALASPEELLRLPDLGSLLQVRRPLPVTWALMTAVYQQELAPLEAAGDAVRAVARFREEVLPVYGNLYEKRAGALRPEIVKSFMLLAVAQERPALRDELLSLPLPPSEKTFLLQIAALLPAAAPAPAANPLEGARQAALLADFDRAFSLSRQASPSLERTRLLFECAYELGTLEAEHEADRAFHALAPGEQETLLRSRSNRDFYAAIAGRATARVQGSAIPTDWIEWLRRLREDARWERAQETARQGAFEWSIEALLSPQPRTEELALLIQEVGMGDAFQDALPHLLAFFQRDEAFPRAEFRGVYLRLVEALVYGTQGGVDAVRIFNELAEALLRIGLRSELYSELVGQAEELWKSWCSPVLLDGMIDFLDLLMVYPCSGETVRQRMLGTLTSQLGKIRERVDASQWHLLRKLSIELSMSGLLGSQEGGASASEALKGLQEDAKALANKKVVIYTLTEAAGRRVRDVLEETFPKVQVQLSHDKVGNDRLKQLARDSDLFVMVTASAKHAATLFIESHRPKDRPLLRPSGKGSASALRVIFDYLKSTISVNP
ncbi:protein DpdD [Hyalangium gracile]|uniref:protein DpdD n=1 Tax=Hyalangium gracile TaxID=394092 RepID=UPI001CC97031|nr:protein DpdD [Hyalangium gracile]